MKQGIKAIAAHFDSDYTLLATEVEAVKRESMRIYRRRTDEKESVYRNMGCVPGFAMMEVLFPFPHTGGFAGRKQRGDRGLLGGILR